MNPAALDKFLWRTTKSAPINPQTKIIETSKSRVRVRDTEGEKPAVVFFCDPPVMVEHYDDLIKIFSDTFRVVVLELTGCGFSKPKSAKAFEFSEVVLAAEDAIHKLKLGSVVLCGPCICGFVAAELARRGNLNIAGLILIQTPDAANMLAWFERTKKLLRIPYIGQIVVRATSKHLINFWFRYATGKQTNYSDMSTRSLEVISKGGIYSLATILQRWGKGLEDDAVEVPALIFWGKQDRSHAPTDRASSLKHVPNAELIEFEHCGHFPELEDPQEFAKIAKPFMDKCLYT
ncbi:alpha/beta hydrolase [Thalassomonas viridans]|uniref:Alpha/beta hydrolase n=1 Tax=Thalassomonas viridans TaxID=137584 RepID=A0AAE9Z5J3_9GAMM|nr:alpha/beta hydrolase [Thalassomonas viridans]WDE07060.1 alpha/beta hydrolase [Thalassomonas viridans]